MLNQLVAAIREKTADEFKASVRRRTKRYATALYHLGRPLRILRSLLYHAYALKGLGASYSGLHLGCGFCRIDRFCNIDASSCVPCDITARIDKLKLASNSVETIYASHVFEHLPWGRAASILSEWHRVLKPGGKLWLLVPDIEILMKIYLENLPEYHTKQGRYRADFAHNILYGGQSTRFDFHYQGYSLTTLAAALKQAGFKSIRRFEREEAAFCSCHDAGYAAIDDVRISLNVEAIK